MRRSPNLRISLLLVLIALPVMLGFVWPGSVEWLCQRGLKHYRSMNFERAERSFEQALKRDPDNATLQHNRATALHQQGRFDAAAESYRAAREGAGESARLRVDASYGLGNTLYRSGDFGKAVDAYQDALRTDPTDGEAKFNLEMAQQKLQEQQEQQQQQRDQDQDQDEERDEERETPDDGEEDAAEPEEQPAQPQDGTEDDEREAPPQELDVDAMSAEEARRLLRSLASEDAEMQKIVRPQKEWREPAPGEKDW